MIDKISPSIHEMLEIVPDGASIAIGGFGRAGVPRGLCDALCDLGRKDLHIIANNAGIDPTGIGRMAVEGRIRKLTASFPSFYVFFDAYKEGKVELELVPQGTLAERMRAAGAGIPAFYTATSVGTDLALGTYPSRYDTDGNILEYMPAKDVRVFDGRAYVLEYALPADFAFIKAYRADRYGNVQFRRSAQNFNTAFAAGAAVTFIEAEHVVEIGEIDPDHIHLQGIHVAHVALTTMEPEQPESATVQSARRATDQPTAAETVRPGWNREALAARVAQDIPDGAYVNLGIGQPLLISDFIPEDREVLFHSENGILGMGPTPAVEDIDLDLVNAGKGYASLITGAATFDSTTSFGMVRGGHLDVAVLGGMEVSPSGDLANWTPPGRGPGVGGAMDLVQGARQVWIMMDHTNKHGDAKLLPHCLAPVTGLRVVDRVYTNLGIFAPRGSYFEALELAPGVTIDEVRAATAVPVHESHEVKEA